MMQLMKPTLAWETEYRAFLEDWRESGETIVPEAVGDTYEPLGAYFAELKEMETTVRPGLVTHSTYWMVDGQRIVGALNFRHDLTENLKLYGGHIGYGIRPSERQKGYATTGLRLALEEARQRGLDQVLLTCGVDNLASRRVILANGGREIEPTVRNGRETRRFIIAL
ncbi:MULTISPECIES: GNAT family N-acetyltransferase [Exiguobacterium]|uniref:GNAT family N-acetyltransferase n=1 Tax=Exiguobacterium TaxID=33986 RepID=UPI000494DA0E|nr:MULTISPECIES: GNAT family N-acetyltransferase [Exiguobacterium]AOT01486.1 GCN5 family acetyltransferase [Exiguobacterium sp. U13-1]HCD58136.1 GNAT family acetyltransferase [Exiguobacterium sp.]